MVSLQMEVAKQIIYQNIRLDHFLRYSLYLATHTNEELSYNYIHLIIYHPPYYGAASQNRRHGKR